MLTELCQEIKNWFDRDQPRIEGVFTITEDDITVDGVSLEQYIKIGQYIRICGSVFNDGVHQYPSYDLTNETFCGTIRAMAIPKEVIALSEEIDAWKEKYNSADSAAMSPFTSESFSGYSYSKSGGGASAYSGTYPAGTWQAVYANRLNLWRKIR